MDGAAWCGACRQARAYLQRTGVAYRYIDIETPEFVRLRGLVLTAIAIEMLLVGVKRYFADL